MVNDQWNKKENECSYRRDKKSQRVGFGFARYPSWQFALVRRALSVQLRPFQHCCRNWPCTYFFPSFSYSPQYGTGTVQYKLCWVLMMRSHSHSHSLTHSNPNCFVVSIQLGIVVLHSSCCCWILATYWFCCCACVSALVLFVPPNTYHPPTHPRCAWTWNKCSWLKARFGGRSLHLILEHGSLTLGANQPNLHSTTSSLTYDAR